MKKHKHFFNWDYFNVTLKEGGLMRLCVSRIKIENNSSNKILIIVPCLIGDFVATVPAIFDFIQRNKDKKIDLVVTSHNLVLAERIKGVNKVFVSKSVAVRDGELSHSENFTPGTYEEVIILRASEDVLRSIVPYIKASRVKNVIKEVSRYGFFDLFINNILRKRPTQWKDFNFYLLGGKPRKISHKEIFNFNNDEHKKISSMEEFPKNSKKKIIIHTGASWPMMKWENDRWVNLIQNINTLEYDFIFIGTEKDNKDYFYISSNLNFKLHSLIAKINVWELAILFHNVDYFIGIDSGPGNVAHLVGLRSIIIYGPGPHTFMSDHEEDIILDKSKGRGFYQRFFLKKKGFVNKITSDEVYEAFKNLIKR